jgi:hypothetical protein
MLQISIMTSKDLLTFHYAYGNFFSLYGTFDASSPGRIQCFYQLFLLLFPGDFASFSGNSTSKPTSQPAANNTGQKQSWKNNQAKPQQPGYAGKSHVF